jgi:hypothetical protein
MISDFSILQSISGSIKYISITKNFLYYNSLSGKLIMILLFWTVAIYLYYSL